MNRARVQGLLGADQSRPVSTSKTELKDVPDGAIQSIYYYYYYYYFIFIIFLPRESVLRW